MSDRAVGLGFFAIAAFFCGVWYLTAAIYKSGTSSWSSTSFSGALDYVGWWLPGFALLAVIAGAVFFVRGKRGRTIGGDVDTDAGDD